MEVALFRRKKHRAGVVRCCVILALWGHGHPSHLFTNISWPSFSFFLERASALGFVREVVGVDYPLSLETFQQSAPEYRAPVELYAAVRLKGCVGRT